MRKALLLSFLLLLILPSWAQSPEFQSSKRSAAAMETAPYVDRNVSSRAIESYWYNYPRELDAQGIATTYFRLHLFPDSSVQVEFSSGYGHVWKHSMGQVFDGRTELWSFSGSTPFIDTLGASNYTVDSIAFPYRYIRHQNAAPDTVFVQVWEDSKITRVPSPGWSSGASYARVDWDSVAILGRDADHIFTILLDGNDTAEASQRFIEIPLGITVPVDHIIATAMTYKPGNPYSFGDTIDYYATDTPVNQINAFIPYEFADDDLELDAGHYNHQLVVPSDVRYNESATGWNGNYLPGTAWLSSWAHMDMWWKVTFDRPSSTGDLRKSPMAVQSLNPIASGSALPIRVRLREAGDLTLSVIDMNGRSVIANMNAELPAGMTEMVLPTQNLATGMYKVLIQGEGINHHISLVVQ